MGELHLKTFNNNPDVSIIIPCFNNDLYLRKCIESVLSQSYNSFELLLLNDGSTDMTLAICEDFQKSDARVKVYSHNNRGVSYTRNRGISLAKTENIMFVDGDDVIKSDCLFKLYSNLSTGNVVICGTINIRNGFTLENCAYKKLIDKNYKSTSNSTSNSTITIIDLLEYETLGSPCARLYSKSLIENNNILFKENLSYQEDLLFNLEYYKFIDKIKALNYFGYEYIQREISSSTKFHKNFDYLEELNKLLRQNSKYKSDIMTVQAFMIQTCLRKLANIFHKDSPKLYKEKLEEINIMLSSDYYKDSIIIVKQININKFLQLLLRTKKAILIFLYYKILH